MNEGPPGAHEMNVGFIQSRSFIRQQSDTNLHARFTEMIKSATRNFGVRIFYWRDDAFDSSVDERIRAGLCAAAMRVRFERNVCRSPARSVTRLFERDSLSMLYLIEEVKAFAGNFSRGIHDHCSHQRTGTNLSGASRCQLERASHHL